MTHPNPWVQTASGALFDLVEPSPDMVRLEDIATALSRIVRFNGHTRRPYTVAEHSLIMSHVAPRGLELEALLHDAHEAYIGDISSPVRRCLRGTVEQLERKVDGAIRKRFGLSSAMPEAIKDLDFRILNTEREVLMVEPPAPWFEHNPGYVVRAGACILGEEYRAAAYWFKRRYHELTAAGPED